jgi:mono/diheme cytochrome c family protein
MSGYTTDQDLERSTNRWMAWGLGLMAVMVAMFPLYRSFEPSNRAAARETHLTSLEEQGATIYSFNCASCHGEQGEGGVGPALNSQQYLTAASDDQTEVFISVGVPGTAMAGYSQDFDGPLTSEQISAVAAFLRSWEETAPDRPDWRG